MVVEMLSCWSIFKQGKTRDLLDWCNRVWQGGTCVLPVLAAVEGKLGFLVTISWRLKLRPCSRLLAEGAAHRHRGFEWTGPTLWWTRGHSTAVDLSWMDAHACTHARSKNTHECQVQGVEVRDSHRQRCRKCRSMMVFAEKCFPHFLIRLAEP